MRTSVQNYFATTLTSEVTSEALTFDVETTGDLSAPAYIVIRPRDPDNREVILCDVAFTGTRFETSTIDNRYLDGSDKTSGQSHPEGAEVWSVPLAQHLDDLWGALEDHEADIGNPHEVTAAQVDAYTKAETDQEIDNATLHRGALVYRDSNQSIASDTLTDISFSASQYDTEGFWNSGTNPERLTIPAGVSKIQVEAQVGFTGSGITGEALLRVQKNDSGAVGLPHARVETSTPYINVASAVMEVAEGDYFTANVRQTSGSSQNAAATVTWMAIRVVE